MKNNININIIRPQNNETINNNFTTIEAEANARLGVEKVEFFFDDELIGVRYLRPYSLYFQIPNNAEEGSHIIEVRVLDIVGNLSFRAVRVNLPPTIP